MTEPQLTGKPPWGLEPAPELASYDDVDWFRKTWFVIVALLIFVPVAIGIALTGDVFQKANARMRKASTAEVWRYTDSGKWTVVVAGIVLIAVGLVQLTL